MGQVFSLIIALLIILFFLGGIVVMFYQTLAAIFSYFLKNTINSHFIVRNLNKQSKAFLEHNFSYYQALSYENRVLFERRVQKFMDMKEFVPRGELKAVTLEMKTLIAASAIQVTFGFPSIYFEHFYKILVYHDDYYSTITKKYHRGEVNTRGFIVLSWKSLLHGYIIDEDGRNLGLHEMAHALKISDSIKNADYDFMDTGVYNSFIGFARMEMHKIAEGEESFFRKYAATNDFEFFAVAIENFFERSEDFRKTHEEMYNLLCRLLNQDPLLLAERPIEYVKSLPEDENVKRLSGLIS